GLSQTDVEEHFVGTLDRVEPRQAAELAAIADKRYGVHAGNVPVGLRHIADARPNSERLRRHVETEHADTAAPGNDEAQDRLEQRALASPVWSQKAHGAGWDRGAHVTKRGAGAVSHGDAVDQDNRIKVGHLLDIRAARFSRFEADSRVPRVLQHASQPEGIG